MAVAALSRQWQRPSTELFFAVTAAAGVIVAAMAGPRLHTGWAILWVVWSRQECCSRACACAITSCFGSAVAAAVAAIAVQEAIP